MDTSFVFYAGLAVLVGLIWLQSYLADKRRWNEGRHSCGHPWARFDTDSAGHRGYTCYPCGGTKSTAIWIGHRSIDREA